MKQQPPGLALGNLQRSVTAIAGDSNLGKHTQTWGQEHLNYVYIHGRERDDTADAAPPRLAQYH